MGDIGRTGTVAHACIPVVITKTLNAEVSQPVSPVKIVNREFPNAKDWDNVQFRLNEDGEIYTLTNGC